MQPNIPLASSQINIADIQTLTAPDFLLVMRADEAEFFQHLIRHYRPQAKIIHIDNKKQLLACVPYIHPNTRIICFCTSIIIPSHILDIVHGNAVNFHPGSPKFPGVSPASFALYQGKKIFGATLHYLDEKIDHGVIIAVEEFNIYPKSQNIYDVGLSAYRAALDLAVNYGEELSNNQRPIITDKKYSWGKKYYPRIQAQNMRRITKDLSMDEVKKRCQYFEHPYCPLDNDYIDGSH